MDGDAIFTGFDLLERALRAPRLLLVPLSDRPKPGDNQLVGKYTCPKCGVEYATIWDFNSSDDKQLPAEAMLTYDGECDRCRAGVTEEEYQRRVRALVGAQEQLASAVFQEQ